MTSARTAWFAAAAIGTVLLCAAPMAAAAGVEEFYRGRNVTILIPTPPGGINDLAARILAQHMTRHMPGNPSFTPQNVPGATGVVGANRLYNISEKDGLTIGILDRGVAQVAILGDPNAKYDPQKFAWLGSISSYANDAYILAINVDSPVQDVQELRNGKASVTIGGMSAGTTSLNFAMIARDVLGLSVKVVRGYPGAAPIFLAMQTRELDGQIIGISAIKAGQPQLWADRKLRVLVQFGRATRLPDIANVPTGRELAPTPDDEKLIEFAEQPFSVSLPFSAPPDVPADRADALQTAFMATMSDPAFVADAQKLGLDLSPIDGKTVRQMVAKAAATPASVLERYTRVVGN